MKLYPAISSMLKVTLKNNCHSSEAAQNDCCGYLAPGIPVLMVDLKG